MKNNISTNRRVVSLNQFFAWVLIVLMSLPPSDAFAQQAPDLPSKDDIQTDESVRLVDSFRLLNQRREVWNTHTNQFDPSLLSDLKPGDPVILGDFLGMTNVKVEVGPHDYEFSIIKSEKRKANGVKEVGPVAKHIFSLQEEDGKVVDVVMDRELIYVITDKGKVFGLYTPLAKSGAFNHPLPLVDLITLPEAIDLSQGTLTLHFVGRTIHPPHYDQIDPNAILPEGRPVRVDRENGENAFPENYQFFAGDVIVTKETSEGSDVIALLANEASLARMHFGLSVVSELIGYVSGISLLTEEQRQQNEKAKQAFDNQIVSVSEDPVLRNSFIALQDPFDKILESTSQVGAQLQNPALRDRFSPQEWRDTYGELLRRAKANMAEEQHVRLPAGKLDLFMGGEGAGLASGGSGRLRELMHDSGTSGQTKVANNGLSRRQRLILEGIEAGDLSEFAPEFFEDALAENQGQTPSFLRRIFNRQTVGKFVKKLSLGTLAVGAVGGAAYYGAGPEESKEFVVQAAQQLYEMMPEPIKRANYRWYMVAAGTFLTMGIPILMAIGTLTSRALGGPKRGFNFARGLGWLATVQYARLIKAYYLSIADTVFHNPNFFPALERSINPFKKVKADSELGQRLEMTQDERLGVVSRDGTYADWQKKVQRRRDLLGKLYRDKLNAQSLATIMSVFLLSEKYQTDPVTVFSMIKSGNLPNPDSPEERDSYIKQWQENARLLIPILEDIANTQGFKSLSEMSIEEFSEVYNYASITIKNYKNRSALRQAGTRLWNKTRRALTHTAIPFVARWGVKESDILKNTLISKPIANESWRGAWLDYIFSTWQQLLIGGRADFSQPQFLGAGAQYSPWLGYTNPDNISDSVEQLFIHGIAVPSRNLINFQDKTSLEEERYSPIERWSLLQNQKKQHLAEGFQEWMGETIFNVGQMSAFGDLLWKSFFVNRFRMIQAGLTFTVLTRMLIAGQSPPVALAAWAFVWGLSPFFAFMWPFIVVGNTKLEMRAAGNAARLREAQSILNQGIRLHDEDRIQEGVERLTALYSTLPQELQAAIHEVDAAHQSKNPDAKSFQKNWLALQQHQARVFDLWEALRVKKLLEQEQASAEALAQAQVLVDEAYQELKALMSDKVKREITPLELLEISIHHTPVVKSDAIDPQKLLEASLTQAPFHTQQSSLLQNMITFLGGVIPSTLIASYLFAYSYSEEMNWFKAVPLSLTAGIGTFYGVRLTLKYGLPKLAVTAKSLFAKARKRVSAETTPQEEIERARNSLIKELAKNGDCAIDIQALYTISK